MLTDGSTYQNFNYLVLPAGPYPVITHRKFLAVLAPFNDPKQQNGKMAHAKSSKK
jgi:hypothetical protein